MRTSLISSTLFEREKFKCLLDPGDAVAADYRQMECGVSPPLIDFAIHAVHHLLCSITQHTDPEYLYKANAFMGVVAIADCEN